MYKISVIIPVYNAENTLKKAINSVINQTIGFENIELILVDDMSTDNSKYIMKKFSDKYSNIVPIFLKENHGFPGFGRNIGIKKSKADYIMFMDNDDEYEPHICETLYHYMITENADLIGCNYNIINVHTNYIRKAGMKYNTSSKINKIHFPEIIYYKDILIWNKIFKKENLIKNDIFFKTKGLGEDTVFCIKYFINSKEMIHVNNYYGVNHFDYGTNLSSVSLEYNLGVLSSYYEITQLFEKYSININYNKMFYNNIQTSIERSILMETNFKNIKEFILGIYKFEKYINFENRYIENTIIKVINFFILKRFFYFITIIIYIVSLISKNQTLKSLYRRQYVKNRSF